MRASVTTEHDDFLTMSLLKVSVIVPGGDNASVVEHSRKVRVKKALIIAGVVIVLMVIAGIRMRPDPIPVWIAKAEKGAVEKTVANTRAGTIKACRRSKLSMPLGGVVDKLLVKKGDRVEAGQLLLELWNRDRYAEVEAAQAAFHAAKNSQQQVCVIAERSVRESRRLQTLAERKLISVDAADNAASNAAAQQGACAAAQSQANSAAAQLEMQRALLERFNCARHSRVLSPKSTAKSANTSPHRPPAWRRRPRSI